MGTGIDRRLPRRLSSGVHDPHLIPGHERHLDHDQEQHDEEGQDERQLGRRLPPLVEGPSFHRTGPNYGLVPPLRFSS